MVKNILLLIFICFLVTLVYQMFFNNPPLNTVSIKIGKSTFDLEVATTVPQKSKGLMNRTSLPSNGGMIFVSDFEMPQAFWMKNTHIPLDMIFVKSNGIITNILTATPEPGVDDNKLKIYQSTSSAKYVIELNSGEADKLGLKSGDKIIIPQL